MSCTSPFHNPLSARSLELGAQERRGSRRTVFGVAVGLAVLVLLIYGRALHFDFLAVDDPVYVSENPRVLGGITWQNVAWCWQFHESNWIPLTWLSLMVDTQVFGPGPGGYHLTNILLHAANTVLLYWVLMRATDNPRRSALVATLFAIHPLHVESVVWIAERKDVLSTLFGLLALGAYLNAVRRRRPNCLAIALFFFVCSLLSKQTLVTLPFLLLLLDFWPLGRQWCTRRLIIEKGPFLFLAGTFSIVALVAQHSGRALATLTGFPLASRCANALVVYVAYLGQTIYPHHLAAYYPHPGEQLSGTLVLGSAACLIVISSIAVCGASRYPYVFVGWNWYLGTLVPMIGIVQVGGQQMADRYTYFPSIGLFIGLVWLVPELTTVRAIPKWILPAVAMVIAGALGLATFIQIGYWRNTETLFRHAIDCGWDSAFARNALGEALVAQGKTKDGIVNMQLAVRMAPRVADWQYNLAVELQKAGRLDEAVERYHTALKLDESSAKVHNNLGTLLTNRHQYRAAEVHLRRAIALDPKHAKAYVNLGALDFKTGEYVAAIACYERAQALDPSLLACDYNIALALRAQGKWDEAIRHFDAILTASPGHQDARRELDRTWADKRAALHR